MNLRQLKENKFIVYILIGGISVLIDIAVFSILSEALSISKEISNFISVSAGITNSFLLNSYLNFKITDKKLQRFVKFYIVGLMGLLLSTVLLVFLVDYVGLIVLLAKVFTIPVVLVFQFVLNSRVSFK